MTDHEYIQYAKNEFGVDVIFWKDEVPCTTTSGRHVLEEYKLKFVCARCRMDFNKDYVIKNSTSAAERKAIARMTLAIKVAELIDSIEWPGIQKEQWKNYSMRVAQEADLSLAEYGAAIKSFDRQIEFARRQKDGFGVFLQDSGDKIAYLQLGFAVEIEFYPDSPENGRKITLRNVKKMVPRGDTYDSKVLFFESNIHDSLAQYKLEFIKTYSVVAETNKAENFLETK